MNDKLGFGEKSVWQQTSSFPKTSLSDEGDQLHLPLDQQHYPIDHQEKSAATEYSEGKFSFYSSGTTGSPKQVTFSRRDWLAAVSHRADYLHRVGVGAGDSVALMISFGPWFSGDNITDALLQIGAKVLPMGIHPAHISAAGELIKTLGLSTIITTPSLAVTLADSKLLPECGRLILIGENVSSGLRKRLLTHNKKLTVTSLYAASEAIIGYEDPQNSSIYRWEPKYLQLEILTNQGTIEQTGKGALLVTKHYGTAMPLQRYQLGDIVELLPATKNTPPGLRFLGRQGHAFGLTTGVQVNRSCIDSFLDQTGLAIQAAEIEVTHKTDGRDHVKITLATQDDFAPEPVKQLFPRMSLELTDLVDHGYLSIDINRKEATCLSGKRTISISEQPWRL